MAKRQPAKKANLEKGLALLRRRFQGGRLAPPLAGLAYRFTIWLPIQARGKPVFSGEQRVLLSDFMYDCFGGCSQTTVEGFPPWTGAWLPAGATEPTIDHHILLVVYTLQDAEALTWLRQLRVCSESPSPLYSGERGWGEG